MSEAGGSRHLARRFAVQALYQWLITGTELPDLLRQFQGEPNMARADREYFAHLLRGTLEHAAAINATVTPLLDRPLAQIDPVEHAILLLEGFELTRCPELPYRIAINEGVELAKTYGAEASHRYINGVLDRLAQQVREGS